MKKITMTDYSKAKNMLLHISIDAKNQLKNDKPAIRQSINDGVDWICKDMNLSKNQRDLLANYACKLHPKN